MPSYKDHPVSERVKLLLLGDSGVGKTGGLADLANHGFKVHVLDMDRGLDVVSEYLKKDCVENLDYVTFNNKDGALEALISGNLNVKPTVWKDVQTALFKDWDGTGKSVYDWGSDDVLVVDSGTFLCDAIHTVVMSEHGVKPDAAKYDRGLWSVTAKRFEALISMLTDDTRVKCNIIITAHLRNIEDEKTQVIKTAPSFLGQQLPNIIPRYMNNMYLVTRKDGKLIYKTAADHKMALKCTMPSIIKAEETRGLGEIFKAMLSAARAKQS